MPIFEDEDFGEYVANLPSSSDVRSNNVVAKDKASGNIVKFDGAIIGSAALGFISSIADAESVFGSTRDVTNASFGSVWNIEENTCTGLPNSKRGFLVTQTGNVSGRAKFQVFYDADGGAFYRTQWGGAAFTSWVAIASRLTAVISSGFISSIADAESAFGSTRDVVNALQNSCWNIEENTCVGLPDSKSGFLITQTGRTAGLARVQLYVNIDNNLFIRTKWGSYAFTSWMHINPREYEQDEKLFFMRGYIGSSAQARSLIGSTDAGDAAPGSVWNIETGACTNLPTATTGMLFSFTGNTANTYSKCQLWFDTNGRAFSRINWGGKPFSQWKELGKEIAVNANAIATFGKIGACGGSLASGESVYTDSDGVDHYIDIYENSWAKLWARKHGISAENFSMSGLSTKTWLTNSVGLAKARIAENKCKVYFCLFGGNDVNAYNKVPGSAATDVNVGNEQINPATYCGNYSKIIAALKSIGGQRTKIFCITYATNFNANAKLYGFNQATKDVAAKYDDVFVIDIENDEVINGAEVSSQKYLGHFSAFGYKLIADRIEQLVDEFVSANPRYFDDVQWIGTDYDVVNT